MSAATRTPEAAAVCYYVLDGAYHGPVSEAELDALHADGRLRGDAQVRTEHHAAWLPYREWHARRERPAMTPPPGAPAAAERDNAAKDADADAAGPRHTCVTCRKEWPESLMLMDARRWLCRHCFYGQAMSAKRKHEKVRRNWWKWLREHWKGASVLLLTLATAAFLAWHYRRELPFDFFDGDDPAEPWARLPPAQWPQLAFTNRADFHRHSSLRGHGIFFARRGDGTVVAATAAHLITADAGVVPDMAPSELETNLRVWWAYPPASPDRAVVIAGLYGSPAALRGFDMLFLRVAPDANTAAVTPLRPARRELRGGEKIFVVAPAAPADPKVSGARQVVFPGRVNVKGGGGPKGGAKDTTLLDVNMDPPILPKDLDGSPVVDERGHLVGIVKGTGDPQDAAGHVNTVVAQGTAAFRELLEPKDPKTGPATKGDPHATAAELDRKMQDLLKK